MQHTLPPWWLASLLALTLATPSWAVQLRFIVPGGATNESSRLYRDLSREFELTEPDIKIDFEPLTSWDAVVGRVRDLAAQGQSSGIFVAEISQTLELEHRGLIQPLDDVLVQQGVKPRDFLAPLSQQFLGASYCTNKKLCALPFLRSVPVALYNLDQLQQAGVNPQRLPTTWAEYEALLERLKQHSKRPPFVLGGEWYDWIFEATVVQAGGALFNPADNHVNFVSPAAVKALGFWKRLKDKGLLDRSRIWKDTITGFTGGRYAATFYSSGGMEAARANGKFRWMADAMPKDVNYGTTVGGGNLYFSSILGSAEQAAAVKFTQFLYHTTAQARISAATGYFPVVDAAFAEPQLHERYSADEPFVRAREQLKYGKPKMMAVDNLKVREILKDAIDQCLDKGVDPRSALLRAQQLVDRLQ